jgi:hypothetical protein
VVAAAAPLYLVAACASLWLPEAVPPGCDGGDDAAAARRAAERSLSWSHLLAVVQSAAPTAALLFLLRLAPSPDAYGTYLALQAYPPDASPARLTAAQLGWTYTLASWAALAATPAAGALLGRAPPLRELGAAVAASAAVGLARCGAGGSFGMSMFAYASLVATATAAAGRVMLMAQLVLYAQLAPPGREAAGFAAVTVLGDLGSLGGGALSAAMERWMALGGSPPRSWDRLPQFIIACCALQVAPLLMLPWLPRPPDKASKPSLGAPLLMDDELTEEEGDGELACCADDADKQPELPSSSQSADQSD